MGKQLNIAFIKASWHSEIVDQSLDGFAKSMEESDVAHSIHVVSVPGAYEMPLQAMRLAKSGKYDAVVAAALVVDGGIYRHDFVAQAVVDGLMRVQLDTDVPTFSVSLTPHHFHSIPDHEKFYFEHFVQKGAEAARAVRAIAEIDV